jgi:hypothetical protein
MPDHSGEADTMQASRTHREQRRYLSYLLRLWQIRSGGELVWRASLESARTGERTGFASVDALFAFLQQQTGVVSDSDGEEDDIGEQRSLGLEAPQ